MVGAGTTGDTILALAENEIEPFVFWQKKKKAKLYK